jgi:hypothetical protein
MKSTLTVEEPVPKSYHPNYTVDQNEPLSAPKSDGFRFDYNTKSQFEAPVGIGSNRQALQIV